MRGDPREWGPPPSGGSAVTIGVYDGVHRGHQAVLTDLAARARAMGVEQRAVLTFDRHPLALVAPERIPPLLTTIEHRLELLESLNVDLVGVLPFEQIREMHPAQFIHQVLLGSLGARLVVVGTNFRFGLNRAGDVAALQTEAARHGFEVDAVELLRGDGAAVSSSAIRALLDGGDVEGAAQKLGRPYELRGVVEAGDGRGRTIGFPTANLSFSEELAVPARGVYAVRVIVGHLLIPGVVNIGVRPTFGGGGLVVEVHLLDFDGDLYGRQLSVQFHARLRDEQRFGGIDELVAQIDRDVETARESLGEIPG
ncbi:MAG: bifunctional riboflavin kinase/FAD synthetase [Acidimicrobiia bacterium]|nr:bifunctional riboflavin kinase/FAD synthetase [Acidimicrobiia bacterium]